VLSQRRRSAAPPHLVAPVLPVITLHERRLGGAKPPSKLPTSHSTFLIVVGWVMINDELMGIKVSLLRFISCVSCEYLIGRPILKIMSRHYFTDVTGVFGAEAPKSIRTLVAVHKTMPMRLELPYLPLRAIHPRAVRLRSRARYEMSFLGLFRIPLKSPTSAVALSEWIPNSGVPYCLIAAFIKSLTSAVALSEWIPNSGISYCLIAVFRVSPQSPSDRIG
jgi:hypothetical protein